MSKYTTVLFDADATLFDFKRSEHDAVIDCLAFAGLPTTEEVVEKYYADYAVLSCKGIDTEKGITDTRETFANLKKVFIRSAKKVILAVDHTKFNKISFVRLSDFDGIDVIVTDVEPDETWKKLFEEKGIELYY